jgi:hypothetical protein
MHITNYNFKLLIKPILPKKRALLVGINYINTSQQLNGCINDVVNVANFLKKKGYTSTVITDTTRVRATKNNILTLLKQLLITSNPGDTCFFHYSGHGTNTMDKNGDEKDGLDEQLVPCDFKLIIDDEIKKLIQNFLPKNVTLFGLMDSCFSGTVFDLKYNYLPSVVNEKASETKSNVIMISGCTDQQTSADALINKKWAGALTTSFLQSVNTSSSVSSLVQKMQKYLVDNQFTQIPQLSSGKNIDITSGLYF